MIDITRLKRNGAWSRVLIVVGGIAMVVGAIDPLEGSLVILPGSALFALGSRLGREERRLTAYRVWVLILIAAGVSALWGLSAIGGIGGSSGPTVWWGLLLLPYPVGWSMGIWGPGSPRWLVWSGIAVGAWYLTLLAMVLARHRGTMSLAPVIILAVIGVATIGGCVHRLAVVGAAKGDPRAGPREHPEV
jgi:hypothetical protein